VTETPAAAPAQVRFWDRPRARWFLGAVVLGSYLRLIRATSRIVYDPPDCWDRADADRPFIATSWHGHSFLAIACVPQPDSMAVLFSNHPDGRMAAALAASFGFKSIDGSGASERQRHGTGGAVAFRNMLKAIRAGTSMFLTADIPPVRGRNIAPGVIALARRTGRALWPIATASSRRRILERMWDQLQLNYPFSTIAFAAEEPMIVNDPAVSDAEYEAELKVRLDRALERAFVLADKKR
jgi:lysophospholipid acyltransferase (LPLAT)-like uncharacterized protein